MINGETLIQLIRLKNKAKKSDAHPIIIASLQKKISNETQSILDQGRQRIEDENEVITQEVTEIAPNILKLV